MSARRSIALLLALLLAACSSAGTDDNAPPTEKPPLETARVTPRPEPTQAPSPSPRFGAVPIGATEVATVLSITDGDTIRVDRGYGSEPVRYIGINTPEVGDPGGAEATAANAALVEGMQVILEKDVSETDQFDRLLRYVWIEQNGSLVFVNYQLVRDGFAQAATYPPDVRFVDYFLAAERHARSAGVGLWMATPAATPQPTPVPTPEPTEPRAVDCHPSYDPCLPIVGDLDCPDVRAMGLAPVRVIGRDDYRLDGDHDGIGCE